MALATTNGGSGLTRLGSNETAGVYDFTHKFVVNYSDLTAASTSQTLSSIIKYATNDYIGNVAYIVNTKFAGTSITALNFIMGTNNTTASDNTNAFVTTASDLASASYTPYLVNGAGSSNTTGGLYMIDSGGVDLTFTATGANLSALTAGQLTIYFKMLPIGSQNKLAEL